MKIILSITIFIFIQKAYSAPNNFDEMVGAMEEAKISVKDTGLPASDCTNCAATNEANVRILLADVVYDLDKLPFYKDNETYTVRIRRQSAFPTISVLNFKLARTQCADTSTTIRPDSVTFNCNRKTSVYEDKAIELNLKKYPFPENGEEQIIEVKITKPKYEKDFFTTEVSVIKGPPVKISQEKKMFSNGYNVSFTSR
jgi:hypothetical protein